VLTLILVILAAVIFEYSNGFHDAANAIATVVSTRVLTPRQAIAMAAFFNFTGALFGGAVASTIGKGLVDTEVVTMTTVFCAVVAAFSWNIATWWFGLPSSSSHALIGGLCGAALAAAKGEWSVIKWNEGVWPKVVLPMIASPVAGCRLRVRRGLHVFVAYRSAPLYAAICSFAIWKTANLQRGLDGPQPRHK
jgi:PiT family inorganic phosphate transporter